MNEMRGSRKHILDWTSRGDFLDELSRVIDLPEFKVSNSSFWRPKGYGQPKEARLDIDGYRFINDTVLWDKLACWWLRHRRGANTPNWDIVVSCELFSRRGLVLVEAKAHEKEMDWEKKQLNVTSPNSLENHEHIGSKITEASRALNKLVPGVNISRDSHYQLANRVAFSWKLASMGIPVILVYLGINGDYGISDVGPPLKNHDHWESVMRSYCNGVLPDDFFDRYLFCEKAQMRMIIRSITAQEQSMKKQVGSL